MLSTRNRLMITSIAAAVLASIGSAAIASATEYEGDEDSDSIEKTIACKSIGCQNGNRECGTAGGGVKVGIPPFVGEVKVEYTCYENPSH